jgi:2-alkenal reductase
LPQLSAPPPAVPLSTLPPAVIAPPTVAPGDPTAPIQPVVLDPAAEQQLYIDLYRRVNPAVVAILVFHADAIEMGLGTGFVIDKEGHIVTNNHVVEGGKEFEVDFANGLKVRAELLGTDPTSDLAVLQVKVHSDQLSVLPLGDSDQVQVGQRVIAIGNPFGLSGTMTVGIVSGLGRTLSSDVTAPGGGSFSAPDIIQTDAAINPGNSGGPLVNLNGEVIGVNKAIESETGVNSGVGFSIASNTVKKIVPALIEDGKYVYPYLGISSTDDLTLAEIEALDLPRTTGVYVTSVSGGGPADEAGLRGGTQPTSIEGLRGGGDLIIAIDGKEVKTFAEMLSYLVNETSVGQTVTLTVLRDGDPQDIKVILGARP